MLCRVLGQLEVAGATRVVRPAAPRQRIVLAMLLLDANRPVPVDRLIDAVWDEAPPQTARSQIQICVSALRQALAEAGIDGAIISQPPGYLFRVGDGELDLHEYERLVTAGKAARAAQQPGEAVEAYGRAMALWTGDALAGLDSRAIRSAAVQLTESRLAVVEELIDIRLSLGQHHELIGELMALTAEYPVRERLRAQLMTALYRDGRQAEALGVYRQTRRTFVEELGLEPGAALQDLERAILVGDVDVVPAAAPGAARDSVPPPRLLPPDIADFTGRQKQILQIRRALVEDLVSNSRPNLVAISGKGGVGKTTLAVHIAHALAEDFPDGQLYVALRGGEARRRSPAEVLERFLRVLGVPGSVIPEGVDERAEIYRNRLAGHRMLVILDDAATYEQVLPLLPGSGAAVIVTSRVRLTTLPGAHRVEIGVLDTMQALELIEQVIDAERVRAEPSAARALVELCGGLPLALRIAAARLAARPHWTIAQLVARLTDEHRRLDELVHGSVGIRTSIAVAYDGLDENPKRLLRRLGILDSPDFCKWVAIPLLDTDRDQAEDALESLVDVQLLDVERSDTGLVRYRFHDLIRVYARERLVAGESGQGRGAALQRVMGAWLSLAREAHRRVYGGDYTVLHGDAPDWGLPADVVDEELQDPLAWYEAERAALVAAVRQAADAGLHDICWDLAMGAVTLFEAHAYYDDWRETHEVALAATQRAGNRRGEAAMLYSLGALSLSEGQFDDAAESLGQAVCLFDELGDVHGRALGRRNLAFIDRVRGDLDQALAQYDRALTGLRAVGDAIGEAHVLSNIAQIRIDAQRYDEAGALLGDALRIARKTGSRRVEAQVLGRFGELLMHRGELARAREEFHASLAVASSLGDAVGEAYALYGLGTVDVRAGEHRSAALELNQARRMARQSGERLLFAQVLVATGELLLATGQPEAAAKDLTEALGEFTRMRADPWRSRAARILERCTGAGV
jgi:DNA-binding SARP family transcriptional activator/tetratricopeptide (TPR) repeat protein